MATVNDPGDHLLKAGMAEKTPYLDITRWTKRFSDAIQLVENTNPDSPVLFSSSWMAGIAPFIVMKCARSLEEVKQIEIDILFSLKDKSGPNSVDYMDRLSVPYPITLNGQEKNIRPMFNSKKIDFSTGRKVRTYNIDTPEQSTLPRFTGAGTVITRIAFDGYWSTKLLALLVKSGIWKAISGDRFKNLRQSMLYNPGDGGEHRLKIKLSGLKNNQPTSIDALLIDPKGQTHLTALGTVIQLERLLGLDGAPPPNSGVVFPETDAQYDWGLKTLSSFGVSTVIN